MSSSGPPITRRKNLQAKGRKNLKINKKFNSIEFNLIKPGSSIQSNPGWKKFRPTGDPQPVTVFSPLNFACLSHVWYFQDVTEKEQINARIKKTHISKNSSCRVAPSRAIHMAASFFQLEPIWHTKGSQQEHQCQRVLALCHCQEWVKNGRWAKLLMDRCLFGCSFLMEVSCCKHRDNQECTATQEISSGFDALNELIRDWRTTWCD